MPVTIRENMDVGLQYTLTVDDKVVDSTNGGEAFHYVHGRNQVIAGLEKQLAGLSVGDRKELTINPEEGYGVIDPAAFVEIPRTQLPQDAAPEVGMMLRGQNAAGQSFQARISEVKPVTVVLDLNHPLAGKTLHFAVEVMTINPSPAPQ